MARMFNRDDGLDVEAGLESVTGEENIARFVRISRRVEFTMYPRKLCL